MKRNSTALEKLTSKRLESAPATKRSEKLSAAQNISLVKYNIRRRARDAEDRASEELSAQMLQMVNNPDVSDVVFVCSDGLPVAASRVILAGRSGVMKKMLTGGDAGTSGLSEIAMPEMSSPVLLSVFEFLYTGMLSKCAPESWRRACELIKASRFFLLPDLETIARRSMLEHTSIYTTKPEAASLLTEAMEFKGLFDENDDNLRELLILLSCKSSASNYFSSQQFLKDLSEDAFRYLLATTKGNCDDVFRDLLESTKACCSDDDELLIEEYRRFRQVIGWWIHHSQYGAGDVDELLNYLTADEERALSISKTSKLANETTERPVEVAARLSDVWSGLQSYEASRNAAIRLLSDIDFRRIKPVLLTTVAEPLKLVSSVDLLSAFRFHAVRRPLVSQKILECGWKHGEAYCTLQGGYSICKSGGKIGLAVSGATVTSSSNSVPWVDLFGGSDSEPSDSNRYYEWHFIVEETPGFFCELGLIDSSELEAEYASFDGEKLSDKLLSWAVHLTHKAGGKRESRMWIMSRKTGGVSLDDEKALKYEGLVVLRKGSRAVFTFDAFADRCSFKLDNFAEIVWDYIPVAKYHPAASFGKSSEGRVRIELVSGFDLLQP